MLNEHTRELISAQQMSLKHNSTDPSCLQQLSPGMNVNTRYINSTKLSPGMSVNTRYINSTKLSPGMSVNTRYINSTKGTQGQLMSLLIFLSTFVCFHLFVSTFLCCLLSVLLYMFPLICVYLSSLHGHLTKTTLFYPEIALLLLGKEARNNKLCNIKPFSKSAEAVSAFSKTNHPTTMDLLPSALHQTVTNNKNNFQK